MTPEYTAFVQSRAKSGAAILETLTPEKCHLLHMAIGISGEVAELYKATYENNKREEAGDTLFYAIGMTYSLPNWTEEDWTELANYEVEHAYAPELSVDESMVVAAGDLLDLVKKYTVYNKPMDGVGIKENLKQLLSQLYCKYGTDGVEELTQENMQKLTVRYPTGYTDAAAIARADKPAGE